MKRMIVLACVVLGLSAAAKNPGKPSITATYNDVINNYIDSYMNSNYKKLDKVMSDDANFKMPRNEQVLILTKAAILEQMKKEGGTKQNCNFNYEVVDASNAIVIAKVNFTYKGFVQHNYLVIEKNDDKQWKITEVCKIFENIKTDQEAAGNITASN